MKFNDAVIGAVVVVFALAMMGYASTFPSYAPGRPGPALFPLVLGVLFLLCGAILIVRGLRSGSPLLLRMPWTQSATRVVGALVFIAGVLVYQFAAEPIGFLPIASTLLFVLMKMLRVSTLTALLSALACALAIHTLFAKFLLVPLPWGILEPIAW